MAAGEEAREGGLVWERDGADWPNREAGRFVEADGLRWHVQVAGTGPVLLLLHGTGASTHSWRDIVPRLARRFTVVAPDLPGHAFTRTPSPERMSLAGMATGLAALLRALGVTPRIVVGHSAGAAIMARMALDGAIAPAGLIGLNGALLPIGGVVGRVFSPLAKLFARSAILPRLFAWRAADAAVVAGLIEQTGSTLDPRGLALYGRLVADPVHAAAALGMMAHWDLWTLERDLPHLAPPLVLVVGGNDRTIAPTEAFRVRDRLPAAAVEYVRGLGHLAHEERPDRIVAVVERYAAAWGVLV